MTDLALFDFDGTITTRDTFTRFLDVGLPRWRRTLGGALLAPGVLGYKAGLVSATRMRRAIAAVGFAGLDAREIERVGERFAREAIPEWHRPEAMERIAWHKGRGDTVVVVSASLDVYLAPWCHARGVELACSVLERGAAPADRRARFTGRYVGGDCAGEEKARRVRERYDLSRYDAVWAYGDTHEDEELLALASRGNAFFRGMPRP